MRINNKGVKPVFQIIYSLLVLGVMVGLFLFFAPLGNLGRREAYILLTCCLGVYLFIRYLGRQKFEYDSGGEVFNLKETEVVLSGLLPGHVRVLDFPKKKLLGYKIRRSLFKKELLMEVTSKRSQNGRTVLKFNLTFMSNKKIRNIKKSLDKNIALNKEREEKMANAGRGK